MINKAIKISDDAGFRSNQYKPERQDIPEVDKTQQFYYRNAMYYLTFFNNPTGSIRFDSIEKSSGAGGTIQDSERLYPANHMIRMILYYLGKQPNLDYAFITQNVQEANKQTTWNKGQDVSEFVNFFRGLMLNRLSNARWTARSVSREVQNKYTEAYDKMEIAIAMAPHLKELEKTYGIGYKPVPGIDAIDNIDDIDDAIDTSLYDENALVATDLANGHWFTYDWISKALKAFMYTAICGMSAVEHWVRNGRVGESVLLPYTILRDTRSDTDYGKDDEFIGKVESVLISDLHTKLYPNSFHSDDITEMYEISGDLEAQAMLNLNCAHINWWGRTTKGTTTLATVYWRTMREPSSVVAKNKFGNEVIRKRTDSDSNSEYIPDIAYAVICGNKWLVDYGYVDNAVESIEDPSILEFPIKRFMPNTFLGENISEVSRIHKIQDELDLLDFKIRDMIAKAKGKVYIIHGDKVGDSTVKELFDDFTDMGIHVTNGSSGEPGDPNERKSAVETVDLTLDPNIYRLADLWKEKKERMGRILSTSNISLGQQTRYLGLGQQQSSIAQNQLGVSYLIDGFLDFLVMNMRYSINRYKSLVKDGENNGLELMVGEKGLRYLTFSKNFNFEKFMTALNINDSIDENGRGRVLAYAQAWSQNVEFGVDPDSILRLEMSKSFTEAADMLQKQLKTSRKRQQENAAALSKEKTDAEDADRMFKAALEQLKQDNENFRAELSAMIKGIPAIANLLNEPAQSPLQSSMQPPQQPPAQA